MRPFSYARAGNVEEAVARMAMLPNGKFLGGGTNLVDLMRLTVETPAALLDVTGLRAGVEETAGGGLRIGGGVRNSDL
ncbi:MAG: FAD binding domain-containing protein, partial [Solirubrobacteraceae bacterium]